MGLDFHPPNWDEQVVLRLDSALNEWVDSVPDHLRWDPHVSDFLLGLSRGYVATKFPEIESNLFRSVSDDLYDILLRPNCYS